MADPQITHKVARDGQALITNDVDPVTGAPRVVTGSPRLAADQTVITFLTNKEQ